jgi:hypothetical protein
MATRDTPASSAFPVSQHVPAILACADITDEEWNALRTAAIQTNSSVRTIVGSLISEYLWANGYVETGSTGR